VSRFGLAVRQITSNLLHATDGRDVLFNSPDGWEVEQPWLWWTGPNGGSTLGPVGHPLPGAGTPVSGAGGIPAVGKATSLIVDEIASLPWHVYRGDTERLATPSWIADPQALRLDGRVVDTSGHSDVRMSNIDFWSQWVLSALWWGDGFVYVPVRDATGAPKPPLWLFHPLDVEIKDGRYWVAGTEMPAGSIIHLRGQTPHVDGRGSGVLTRYATDLGLTQSLRTYMAGAFTSGVPAGYLKTSASNITQDQADALKSRWMTQHSGKRTIAVLNATTEFHPLSWTPVDTEAGTFAQLTLTQIALMFCLPTTILGGPSANHMEYSTTELRNQELYVHTWLPWIRRIEAVLDAQLPAGTSSRVVVDGVLRADTKTRYESYAIAIASGFRTIDECRALENLPPLQQEAVL